MINCERLFLRGVREDDVERIYQICSEPNIVKWLPSWNLSMKDLNKWAKNQEEQYEHAEKEDVHVYQVVTLKTSNQIVGLVGLNSRPDLENQVEIVCFISNRHANKGYATEAVKGILCCGAPRLDIKQMIGICQVSNYSAKRMLEKNAFVLTETKSFMNIGNKRAHAYEFYEWNAAEK